MCQQGGRTQETDFTITFIVFKVHFIPLTGSSPWKLHYNTISLLQIFTYYILVQFLFPHFNNPISWRSNYKPLCGLKSRDICDNIMMPNRERLWTLPRGLISGSQLLLVLNFLYKNKVRNTFYRRVSICKETLSSILGCQCKKTTKPLPPKKQSNNNAQRYNLVPFDCFLRITPWFISFHHTQPKS